MFTSETNVWLSQRAGSKQLSVPSGQPAWPPLLVGSVLCQL
jgi:hypothetical protein